MLNNLVNKLPEIQDLLKAVTTENKTFSFDALHCQKQTIKIIIEGNNHYLIHVKKNQKTLYYSLEKIIKEHRPNTVYLEKDNSHGKQITRQVSTWNNYKDLPKKISDKFEKIKNIIEVKRNGMRGEKPYEEKIYYISSILEMITEVGKKIRNHWRIENQLHWVKDVIMDGDSSKIKQKQGGIKRGLPLAFCPVHRCPFNHNIPNEWI
ncbi:ISAs1 family transposase [Cyanobacterium aponinum]|uniref:ISAs1 family transposase n=1 Tax=Cyanobacterium aponinum 0216 TaxID=2676140 RepID=A0A844GTN8_9CHRO|nr:ISAs1 family transposase [Cyanobacterium aponinum]MTF38411.1 ISAs1 family transposase [Cyanobacterium aponinum 0216]